MLAYLCNTSKHRLGHQAKHMFVQSDQIRKHGILEGFEERTYLDFLKEFPQRKTELLCINHGRVQGFSPARLSQANKVCPR